MIKMVQEIKISLESNNGLTEEEIPFGGKIIAVADCYHAMTSSRAYREALSKEESVQEMLDVSGKQLDAEITRVFIQECLVNLSAAKDDKNEQ